MSIWQRLLYWIGLRPHTGPRTYEISESMQITLVTLASHEGRPVNELLPDLLAAGLTQYSTFERLWSTWESLSPREKDVAALVCLGYTNRQIAGRLNISPETVKVRLQKALAKFHLTKRADLRVLLAGWDFTAWENLQ